MNVTSEVNELLSLAAVYAGQRHHEYLTPEHVLYVMADLPRFRTAFENCGGSCVELKKQLEEFFEENLETVDKETNQIQVSYGIRQLLDQASAKAVSSSKEVVELTHLVYSMMELEECYGAYLLELQGVDLVELLYELNLDGDEGLQEDRKDKSTALAKYTVCVNDAAADGNPLIGREQELERTMQVLCRRQKNNPLHIGEPGVGKTAITYGLARRINEGRVPVKLQDARIFAVDLGSMIAGTQFRGDFEKRFKEIMEALEEVEKPILYIDEIHNLVGAGAVGGGSMDASNMLKPYLTGGKVRVIGATTYEEYKKHFSRDKGLVRRFQNIDIKEPTVEETVEILNGLKPLYEKFHQVRYQKGTMEHAAGQSSRYINERFLPDKAIDLIDEAGAWLELHPKAKKIQVVDKKLIDQVLSGICNIPEATVETGERQKLARLEDSLKRRVFGQNEAVTQLANAIKLSKSGLGEENKPVGSLLFVGPTGVGKTELARALADVLGSRLVRFDMSEYAEKHTVAKLIGSPAGYVGYEEGGLLTEEIRKHPYCVLLLDEIEKAHPDIYNILLQVMDYATLTDNQGRKADFRNVILIMTSNAGADKAGKAAIGFGGQQLNEGAISDEVKRVFRPEFRNRLDKIIIFKPLNEDMSARIVERQFKLLSDKAAAKGVELKLTKPCTEYLVRNGLSREYGAREILRIIAQEVKPLLAEQLLFGKLKKGGLCQVDYDGEKIRLII